MGATNHYLAKLEERRDGEMGLDRTRTRIRRVHRGSSGCGDAMTAAYDYRLQVWTVGGVVQTCGHPQSMRLSGPCCNQYRYAGQRINPDPPARIIAGRGL